MKAIGRTSTGNLIAELTTAELEDFTQALRSLTQFISGPLQTSAEGIPIPTPIISGPFQTSAEVIPIPTPNPRLLASLQEKTPRKPPRGHAWSHAARTPRLPKTAKICEICGEPITGEAPQRKVHKGACLREQGRRWAADKNKTAAPAVEAKRRAERLEAIRAAAARVGTRSAPVDLDDEDDQA